MLVLQFLGLGNLSRWIAKTHTEDTKFPDKYLWLIAQCREYSPYPDPFAWSDKGGGLRWW